MNCKLCGKEMVIDGDYIPYDSYGTKAYHYVCEDDNCKGEYTELCFHNNITAEQLSTLYDNAINIIDEEVQILKKLNEILTFNKNLIESTLNSLNELGKSENQKNNL